jgi:hypothetical protein
MEFFEATVTKAMSPKWILAKASSPSYRTLPPPLNAILESTYTVYRRSVGNLYRQLPNLTISFVDIYPSPSPTKPKENTKHQKK